MHLIRRRDHRTKMFEYRKNGNYLFFKKLNICKFKKVVVKRNNCLFSMQKLKHKEVQKMLLQFEYFYGNEAEDFTFYRIPKKIITSSHFKDVSYGAKMLYGLLFDRVGLSIMNSWFDEENRAVVPINRAAPATI